MKKNFSSAIYKLKGAMEDNIVMISYLKSGRCWWIFRLYDNDTFDLFYSCHQPTHDAEVPRQRYDCNDLEKVVLVGELKDWISGAIGKRNYDLE